MPRSCSCCFCLQQPRRHDGKRDQTAASQPPRNRADLLIFVKVESAGPPPLPQMSASAEQKAREKEPKNDSVRGPGIPCGGPTTRMAQPGPHQTTGGLGRGAGQLSGLQKFPMRSMSATPGAAKAGNAVQWLCGRACRQSTRTITVRRRAGVVFLHSFRGGPESSRQCRPRSR